MIRKIATYLLACYFLMGSMLLPLGDFSLMKNLPCMYRAYAQLASPDEQGVLDFIGDYLLNGKVILGHNKHDAPDSHSNVQYQHAATFCSITAVPIQLDNTTTADHFIVYGQVNLPVNTSDFHAEFFRPPLTATV